MSKKAKLNDDKGDISSWYKVTDPTFELLLQPGDRLEFDEGVYMHWGLFVGLSWSLGAGSSKDEAAGNIVHLSKQKGGIRLEMLNKLNEKRVRKNNSADEKMTPFEPSKIVTDALNAVNKEDIYSITAANCENFVNYIRYGESVSHQVEEWKDVILDSSPANLTPTSKLVTGMIGEFVTSSDVFETDNTSTTDPEEEIETGEIMEFSSLLSEAGKTSKTTDKKTKDIIDGMQKLGCQVDEKYTDLRKTSFDVDQKLVIQKVLSYKSLIVGNPELFMKDKKGRKLFCAVEELDDTTKKVLMVLLLTLTEMKSRRDFGSDEKVASILQLASLLYYSTVKMERSGKARTRNEELENIFKLIKQNMK